jgi:hypothetical protein
MWDLHTDRWEGRRDDDDWDADDDCAKRDARLRAEAEALTMVLDCWRCTAPVTVLIKDFIRDNTIDHCPNCYPWGGTRRWQKGWK